MSDISDLEAEASANRAKLQDTIGLIRDKLTVSGVIDDFMGQTGVRKLDAGRDALLSVLRQHPLPVLAVAAVTGFAISRINRRRSPAAQTGGVTGTRGPYLAGRPTVERYNPGGIAR